MTQINGGNDMLLFDINSYDYGLAITHDKCTVVGNNCEPATDATITLSGQSAGYYLQMYGGTIILDNYTGTYDGDQPLINGMGRDLTIILKGSSVIKFKGDAVGILTSGNVKLGGSGELKFVTNEKGYFSFGINSANYNRDHDVVDDLSLDNTYIKRIEQVNNVDGTCTWTYCVGMVKPLSKVTKEDIGKPVSADGEVYPGLSELQALGGTLAGMLASVNETGHGLILSSKDLGTSTSLEDAKNKAAALTPAIAGCEPWHLPTEVEAVEMVSGCAGVEPKPIKYVELEEEPKPAGIEMPCKIDKLSEKAVKAGVGNVSNMIADLNGERALVFGYLILRHKSIYGFIDCNNSHFRACAKF